MQLWVGIDSLPQCCGMRELSGASQARNLKLADVFLESFGRKAWKNARYFGHSGPKYNMVTFNGLRGYTGRIARRIKENNLGEVVGLAPTRNPNSGNIITAYLWAPNWERLDSWAKEREARRVSANR
jgi:hypothetical protein